MTGPTAYMPKPDDVFDAIVITLNKATRGSPCICKKVREDVVTALDDAGNIRNFSRMDFVFRKVKDDTDVQKKHRVL